MSKIKKIKIIELGFTTVLNEDGEFRCPHEDIEYYDPCCSGYDSEGMPDCDCGGSPSVYCNDCNNIDLTDDEAIRLISSYRNNSEDDYSHGTGNLAIDYLDKMMSENFKEYENE